MRMIESQTKTNSGNCITFVPRTTQANYIRIINSPGCTSYVKDDKYIVNNFNQNEISILLLKR